MKTTIWAFLPLFLASVAGSTTPPTRAKTGSPPDDSVAFVRLLRIDEMMSELLKSRAQQSFEAGRITKSQLACLQTTSAADFTRGLASVVRQELAADETTKAVAYLRSKDGRVYGEMLSLDRADPTTARDLTPSELEALTAFRNSPVGKKLDETALLMKTEGVREVVAEFAKSTKAKCHLTQPLLAPDDQS